MEHNQKNFDSSPRLSLRDQIKFVPFSKELRTRARWINDCGLTIRNLIQ